MSFDIKQMAGRCPARRVEWARGPGPPCMRQLTLWLAISAALGIGGGVAGFLVAESRGSSRATRTIPPAAGGAVVVAELFTSEGCSSCPPADDILSQLVEQPPAPGVNVLGLGEHVDYWDHLGWRDRFSSPGFSARQAEYMTRVFHGGSIYTPQIVIDGRFEVVGSDLGAIRGAIAKAAGIRKAAVDITASPIEDEQVQVRVHVDAAAGVDLRERAYVLVGLTQDRAVNDVRRGENSGRRLRHSAVVRSLVALDSMAAGDRTFTAATSLPIAPEWAGHDLRVVGLVQEQQSRHIVGAGAARVPRTPEPR